MKTTRPPSVDPRGHLIPDPAGTSGGIRPLFKSLFMGFISGLILGVPVSIVLLVAPDSAASFVIVLVPGAVAAAVALARGVDLRRAVALGVSLSLGVISFQVAIMAILFVLGWVWSLGCGAGGAGGGGPGDDIFC